MSDSPRVPDEQLWSWVDAGSPELDAHLRQHPEDAARVAELRAAVAAVASARPAPLPPSIGPYRVLGLLGEGGMGVVYSAEQPSPRRRVAVKVIRAAGARDARARRLFARECEALARVSHPAVAAIHAAGETEDGLPYLVMEQVAGRPLDEFVARHACDRRRRLELFAAICRGVAAAHGQGVVHRDLKPGNVLVDGEGRPRIVDFGLARLADATAGASLTVTGRLAGTVPYSSPEQLAGERGVGPASDVWSLGVILHELLTGELPHPVQGRPLPAVIRSICEDAPRPAGARDPSLRGDLERILAVALERDPRRRYASADALAADVERYLRGEPVEARGRGGLGRAAGLLRRHRWPAAAATAALLLVAVTAAWLLGLGAGAGDRAPLLDGQVVKAAPYRAIRWRGTTPEVLHEGVWYELEAIGDDRAADLVAFARQHHGERWRKRFEEDLVQLRHEMGRSPEGRVDLELRDPVTGRVTVAHGVPMTEENRALIWAAAQGVVRGAGHPKLSPFTAVRETDGVLEVRLEADSWYEWLATDGVPTDELVAWARLHCGEDWLKRLSEDLVEVLVVMRHPLRGDSVDLRLREGATGEVVDLARVPMTAVGRERARRFNEGGQ